jgi:subtilisin family serine protease
MRRATILATSVLAFAPGAAPARPAPAPPANPYVVVFDDGAVPDVGARVDTLQRALGFTSKLRYSSALDGFAADLTDAQAAQLAATPGVAFVHPDTTISMAGTSTLAAGETVPAGIRRIGAVAGTEAHAASGAGVAVLDTGIDLANRDLAAVSGTNCIKPGTAAADDNGHGTHVAGTIAARNSGSGVVGVAPGTTVYAVKVLNAKGTGTLSQILCGINWVTANAAALNIKIANMSIAGLGMSDNACGATNKDAEHKAICSSVAAGVTYIAAAGNSGANFATSVPAAYPEVLTVTAMSDSDGLPGGKGATPSCKKGEKDDTYATYSNYAVAATEQAHAIAAPGTCVVSDAPGGRTAIYYGTSQAAPHVAGAAALCIDDGGIGGPCAGLSPAQIVQRLRADAAASATLTNGFAGDPLRPVAGRFYGYAVAAGTY